MLIQTAPRALSMLLPAKLTFIVGASLMVFGVFGAFCSAFALQHPEGMLDAFVTLIVGVWFMFAASAGMRGSSADDDLLRRFGAMMALLLALIVSTLYVNDPRVVSLLSLGLIGGGVYVSRDFLIRPGR